MKTSYLKCQYKKGLWEGEYLINFNATNQRHCNVNKNDVLVFNNQSYVKCSLVEEFKAEAIVWINDVGDQRVSAFRVPRSDLMDRLEEKQAA